VEYSKYHVKEYGQTGAFIKRKSTFNLQLVCIRRPGIIHRRCRNAEMNIRVGTTWDVARVKIKIYK
jgi:hypothetical protein